MNSFTDHIEECKLTDLHELVAISRSTFFETFAAFNTKEDMDKYFAENLSYDHLLKEFNTPGTKFYFYKDKGEITGYLKLNFDANIQGINDPHAIEIARVYVKASHHGKQQGYTMFLFTCELALHHSSEYIWLGVWKQNPKAIAFYQKIGFEIFGEHTFILGNDVQYDHLMKYKINRS